MSNDIDYKGIKKLQPGHYVCLKDPFKIPNPKPFWDIFEITKTQSSNIYDGIENDAINQLELILEKSIESRMVSDVPIGAFLSGGIDSSTIVSIMQKVSNKPINTFTIGFKDQKYNEASKAKKIANPAFDVTPRELVSGIITEKGIIKKQFEVNWTELSWNYYTG